MTWNIDDPVGNEAAKIRWELVPYTRGTGLDLGCGPWKAFPHFIGVDSGQDQPLLDGRMNQNVCADCRDLKIFGSQTMDFVFSSHLLEHMEDHKATLKEWWRVIKVGGFLCLYLPHKKFYPNIGKSGSNPDHKHDFLPEDIIEAMKGIGGWDLLENQERDQEQEYSFFQVYKKLGGQKWRMSCNDPKPEKTAAVVRLGAFGDLLQASSIFPQLKAQGYHITLYAAPRGYEVVKHDPHIDRVILQDPDQVPNAALSDFWAYEEKKYDKWINLSESVEGTFLAIPGRTPARWPHEARHKMLNGNYLEFHHDLAGLPFEPHQKFYATEEEKQGARRERAKIGGDPVIMWSLSGSSIHKHWPHMDSIIAGLLLNYPNCRVVLVGDDLCKMLEAGWDNESRVLKKSGQWSIRETLAFIPECDLIIGPETGVLNAAGFMDVPKIVTLSHSSQENLTRDWVNTIALEPESTPCYPCHLMHYGFSSCKEGFITVNGKQERVGALCQVNISPDQMWTAIQKVLDRREREAA
jgi:ADP-heptose:LPS heptosyltransferase/predicted SAM-dependent methyltransferase